ERPREWDGLVETNWVLPVRCAARWDLSPHGWSGWWEAAFSGGAAIAPVEITKNATEMPMVRRISIRHCLLFVAHPRAKASDHAATPMVLDQPGDGDRCRPGLLPMHPGRTG